MGTRSVLPISAVWVEAEAVGGFNFFVSEPFPVDVVAHREFCSCPPTGLLTTIDEDPVFAVAVFPRVAILLWTALLAGTTTASDRRGVGAWVCAGGLFSSKAVPTAEVGGLRRLDG